MKLPPTIARLIGELPTQRVSSGRSRARVWRIGTELHLKSSADHDELEGETARLRWFAGRACVPEVIAFERDRGRAHLFTRTLHGAAAHESTAPIECVNAVGAGLHLLHRLVVAACPFDARVTAMLARAKANTVAGRVDELDFDAQRAGRRARDLLVELEATRPQHEDLVVTHGDYCLANVILGSNGVAGFVDVGRAGVADRHQDLALAARSIAVNFGVAYVEPLFAAYGANPDPRRIAFYQLLDEFF